MANALDREKVNEPRLVKEIKKLGGLAIKLWAISFAGLPDRLILLPGAKVYFVETKSKGKEPSKIQKIVHRKLQQLGFEVHIIYNEQTLINFLEHVHSKRH